AAPGDRLADPEPVLPLDEGDVVYDEEAGFLDPRHLFDSPLRADEPVTSSVEGPGAAERAVPRTAAREFDRRARVEHADEILAAMAQKVGSGMEVIQTLDETGRRTFAVRRDHA